MLPSDIQDAGDISIETAPLVIADATGLGSLVMVVAAMSLFPRATGVNGDHRSHGYNGS